MKIPQKRESENLPKLGFILLASVSLFWGFSWPIMKIALREIPPWTFRTLCLFIGGIGLLVLAKISHLNLTVSKKEIYPLLCISLLNITGWHLFSALGLIRMNAARAVIIAFTMPVWASILGNLFLKERLTSFRLIGLCLGSGGLLILMGHDIQLLGKAPLGALFMLGAAISWAGGTVFIKYYRWTMTTTVFIGWQLILGGIPIIIGALTLETTTAFLHISWKGGLAMVYIIFLPIFYCQWAWIKVVELFPATIASIGTLLIPVLGVFSSALVLGERIGLQEILALVLVLIALMISLIRPKG